jgi:ABC-type nitrate/sulfonate/bicarbonate transport system substrate-binding protein
VVAISGHVNGGSDIMLANTLTIAADDWAAFKTLAMERKSAGKPLRIASSRGSAQDIHLRGELAMHGIDANKDIEFVNIPNFPDHGPSLQRGEIDAVCTVEPFASQIRLSGMGKHFSYPYTQAAGNLTGLILTRGDVIKAKPAAIQELVAAIWRVNQALRSDRKPWIEAIGKATGLDRAITEAAMANVEPDSMMYRQKTIEIAKMMRDLKYTTHDVTGEVDQALDYSFLIKAAGKPKESLGW